jgi:hypothetical protein
MPEPIENYWGTNQFLVGDSPPVELLKQQASMLTEITGGRVKGVVKESAEGGTAFASLYASVPAMGDYQFKILYIAHPLMADPANPFPIEVEDSFGHDKQKLSDMAAFDLHLKNVLSSRPVRTAIGNLVKYGNGRVAS